MERKIVQIAKMRLADLRIGDVVNRDPDATHGWFVVGEIRRMADEELNVTSESLHDSVVGGEFDIVGIQGTRTIQMADDDHHG